MHLEWFSFAVFVWCSLMAIIWKKDDWINVGMKSAFFALSLWALINFMTLQGYLIKVPV